MTKKSILTPLVSPASFGDLRPTEGGRSLCISDRSILEHVLRFLEDLVVKEILCSRSSWFGSLGSTANMAKVPASSYCERLPQVSSIAPFRAGRTGLCKSKQPQNQVMDGGTDWIEIKQVREEVVLNGRRSRRCGLDVS